MLLVTCTGLFSGCCLAVHWGQTDAGKHASPLEALQAADEGSKRPVSPANIGDLHSSPSQREQQTIAHCHRPHRPNHREEFTRHLSDKEGFKFHSESLDEKKKVVIKQKAIDKVESIRPSFKKVSGREGGSRSPSRQPGPLVPLSLPSADSSRVGLQCSTQGESPQPVPHGAGL